MWIQLWKAYVNKSLLCYYWKENREWSYFIVLQSMWWTQEISYSNKEDRDLDIQLLIDLKR